MPQLRPAKAHCRACDHIWRACPEPEEPVVHLSDPVAAEAGALADAPRDRHVWPWALAAAVGAAAAGLWIAALMQQWRPEDLGLPPAAVPSLAATQQALARSGLALPPMVLAELPALRLPEAKAPSLGVSAEAITRAVPGGGQIWEVRGEVRNPGQRTQTVPPLEVILLSADGREVGRWTVRADTAQLPPGGAVAFETSAVNPPADARRLSVRLRPPSLARL